MFQFIHILLVKGDEIVRPCNRNGSVTVTIRKHVTKYKTCKNWWSNFSENLSILALKLLD